MNTNHVLLALAALAWLGPAPGHGQDVEARACTAYPLTGEVRIDGKLDEQAWTDLPEHTGFFWKGSERYAGIQAAFQVGYDDEALYVGIWAEEPKMAEHLEHARKNDTGETSWKYQLCEVFVSPETAEGPQHFQFAVDILGYRQAFRARMEGKPYEYRKTEWVEVDIPWEAAVNTATDSYTMEIRFPFESLGAVPRASDKWGLHVGRSGTSWPRAEKLKDLHWAACAHSAWNAWPGEWRIVDEHGRMVFAGEQLMAGAAQKLSEKINRDYHAWQASDKELEALVARTEGQTDVLKELGREVRRGPNHWERGVEGNWRFDGNRMPWYKLLEWDTAVEFNCNVIRWKDSLSYGKDYALEVWDGETWQVAYAARDHAGPQSCHVFPPVRAVKARLFVAACGGRPTWDQQVKEFGLYRIPDSGAGKEK